MGGKQSSPSKQQSRYNQVQPSNLIDNQYVSYPGDLVIATVLRSAVEQFFLQICPHSPPVVLQHLSFENVSRKTRPQLNTGATVYARVLSVDKHLETELVCFNPSTGKADGLGELKGGMLFDISPGMSRRLLLKKSKEQGGVAILDILAEKLNFELAVGLNGRLWVDGSTVRETMAIGKAVQETDQGVLDFEKQRKLAGKLLREVGMG